MILDFIRLGLTTYKVGRVGLTARYIAFDFDPKDKAKMRGFVVEDAAVARDLEHLFKMMAESLEADERNGGNEPIQ